MDVRYTKKSGDQNDMDLHIDALRFFSNELMPEANIMVDLHMVKRFRGEEAGSYGDCDSLGDGKFRVRIKQDQSSEQIIATIAHEMVHVKQYHTGELRSTDHTHVWQDKYYRSDKRADELWEAEPNQLELPLTQSFYNHRLTTNKEAV